MRLHRFFVDQSFEGETIVITDADLLHQWSRVLRYTGGEQLALIDGKGAEVVGTLTSCSRTEVVVEVTSRTTSKEPEQPTLTLYFSPLKRDLTELVLQKGTELGVSCFQPILCDRTVRDGFHLERTARILKEATEQSGRLWLPEFQSPCSFKEALAENKAQQTFFSTLVVSEERKGHKEKGTSSIALFVGPEGGWTEVEERQALEAGYTPFQLSAQVLRAETACIAGVALLRAKSLV